MWLWIWGLLGVVAAKLLGGRRLAWRRAWAPLAVAMLGLTLWTACGGGGGGSSGGGGNPGTPAGTYNLTVTATCKSGTTTAQHAIILTLKVN